MGLNNKGLVVSIIENWVLPECKVEGYEPVAFFYKNGTVELDFFNENKGDFLSEYDELFIKIDYPFIKEFEPSIDDWEQLGFITLFE